MISASCSTDRIVCHCLRVTESQIQDSVARGEAESIRQVIERTGAGSGCTACQRAIRSLLGEAQCPAGSSPT